MKPLTYTTTNTFTITHARYVTSKVAADLRQLQLFYGAPTDSQINSYAEEAALLLRDGYLERVDYGFRRSGRAGNEWVLLMRYVAANGVLSDDRSGRVPAGVDVSGTTFSSFLTYAAPFFTLSPAERERVKAALPIQRASGVEAGFVSGIWSGERGYSSSDRGVIRWCSDPYE